MCEVQKFKMKEDKCGVTRPFFIFWGGNDASVEMLSVLPFDLISELAPLIKEQASFTHYRIAFEPQTLRVK